MHWARHNKGKSSNLVISCDADEHVAIAQVKGHIVIAQARYQKSIKVQLNPISKNSEVIGKSRIWNKLEVVDVIRDGTEQVSSMESTKAVKEAKFRGYLKPILADKGDADQ